MVDKSVLASMKTLKTSIAFLAMAWTIGVNPLSAHYS